MRPLIRKRTFCTLCSAAAAAAALRLAGSPAVGAPSLADEMSWWPPERLRGLEHRLPMMVVQWQGIQYYGDHGTSSNNVNNIVLSSSRSICYRHIGSMAILPTSHTECFLTEGWKPCLDGYKPEQYRHRYSNSPPTTVGRFSKLRLHQTRPSPSSALFLLQATDQTRGGCRVLQSIGPLANPSLSLDQELSRL
jgi:hypothetical protein